MARDEEGRLWSLKTVLGRPEAVRAVKRPEPLGQRKPGVPGPERSLRSLEGKEESRELLWEGRVGSIDG